MSAAPLERQIPELVDDEEHEVNPAVDAALAAGLEVTALHNHFFFDDPKVYFMHIGGRSLRRLPRRPHPEGAAVSGRQAAEELLRTLTR